MASEFIKELEGKSSEELQALLLDKKAEYSKLKFDHVLMGIENPLVIRTARRDIARINTVLRRKDISSLTPEQLSTRSKIRNRRRSRKN